MSCAYVNPQVIEFPGKRAMKSSLRRLMLLISGLLVLTVCATLVQPLLADGIPPDPQIPLRTHDQPGRAESTAQGAEAAGAADWTALSL